MPVPGDAWNPARRQYRAEAFIEAAHRERGEHVLGVTDLDLYSGRLNFVFGVADPSTRVAVMSLHRLRAGADARLARERALKEAVHELGHTFGLRHCSDPACVMAFSNRLADTDHKTSRFCPSCSERIA